MSKQFFPKGSVFFAPLEGHCDEFYRSFLAKNYPEWSAFCCEFFRLSRHAPKNTESLALHFGKKFLTDNELRKKTVFQILTSKEDAIENYCQKISELNIPWLDLNAGCPMKRIISHKGGSYLLSEIKDLQNIVSRIRKSYPYLFSVKIRIGLQDDKNFFEILKMLQEEGVDTVTLHARLQTQFYSGKADWDYIKKAQDYLKIPLIGNGDLTTPKEIDEMFTQTQCHSVMIGRAALKMPWLAKLYLEKKEQISKEEYKNYLLAYYRNFYHEGLEYQLSAFKLLCRLKAIAAQVFSDFKNGQEIQVKALRATEYESFISALEELSTQEFCE